METTHMSINGWMNQQVYLYNEILLSTKKEWNANTHYDMYKLQKHYAMWKKSVTKGLIYYSIYMKYNRIGKSVVTEID